LSGALERVDLRIAS